MTVQTRKIVNAVVADRRACFARVMDMSVNAAALEKHLESLASLHPAGAIALALCKPLLWDLEETAKWVSGPHPYPPMEEEPRCRK